MLQAQSSVGEQESGVRGRGGAPNGCHQSLGGHERGLLSSKALLPFETVTLVV